MSTIHTELEQFKQTYLKDAWKGIINSNPPDFATRVTVIIPGLDPGLELGPCLWMPRDAVSLPAKGDECLVIFDNEREPWVVAWGNF
jgi:hypothetical protein